ncbi:ureidoglycolate lyase [Yunchengibacter salinarum]|uniref:ureidoglycolate lyase n=1 Tax=Yunchengibacter salinarum TaxID=3133399 RepID=UPI0035B5C06B
MSARPITLTARPLTADAFAPFGDVVEADERAVQKQINYGRTTRFHDLAEIDVLGEVGRVAVNIFRSQPVTTPWSVAVMERHPLSSQLFMPLGPHPYLVVVGEKGSFDPVALTAFLASGDQGVNYHPGTWHHYSLALQGVSDFLVVDRVDARDHVETPNCDEVVLDDAGHPPVTVHLPGA